MVTNQQRNSIEHLLAKCIKIINKRSEAMKHRFSLNNLILLENYKFGFKLVNDLLPIKILECTKTDQKGLNLVKTHKYRTRYEAIPNMPRANSSKYC